MMNRTSSKDSVIGIGSRNHHTGIHNASATRLFSHRRVMSASNTTTTTEDFNNSSNNNNVHHFSRSFSVASSDISDLQARLRRLSLGSAKPTKSVSDDLLQSNEAEKHDYDWLLTPPGTPLFPSSDGKESQQSSVASRNNSSVRSGSTIKTSRLYVSQSESSHPSRPARSSSVTRTSISTTQYTSYSNRNTNILNTSSASISSYIRPSSPTNPCLSTARLSTASSLTTPSRASTPSRTRQSSSTISIDRTTRPSQNTRPSTPISRLQTPGNLASPTIRPASRSSTPARRSPTPLAPSTASSPSAGRALSRNGRSASTSRPSSPSSRVGPTPQPIILPDFPLETPPNLRTTLPDRPLSAGRSRPGATMTIKGHVETTNSASMTRRQSSPVVTRGRVPDPSPTRKPIKLSNSENAAGFGRSISKKSFDMAVKHMDIRNVGIRPLSGSTLFPQSIRAGRASSALGSKNDYSENQYTAIQHKSCKVAEVDMILLKEDLKSTSWLHSADDEAPLFDNGFETLPEPFGPL